MGDQPKPKSWGSSFPVWAIAWALALLAGAHVGPSGVALLGPPDPDRTIQADLIRLESAGEDWALLRWTDPTTGATCYADTHAIHCHGGDNAEDRPDRQP